MDEVVEEYTFYMLHHIDNNPDGIYDDAVLQYYIGSTTRSYKRVRHHISRCNNPNDDVYNLKLYQHIRSTGGFDEWECSILEKLYLTKKEAHIHERMLIELYKSELNTVLPSRSESEYTRTYNAAHKEERNEKGRSYYASHKEERKAYKIAYNAATKEERSEYSRTYYVAHKKERSEYARAYNASHKEDRRAKYAAKKASVTK
jgi:hypothetical protein